MTKPSPANFKCTRFNYCFLMLCQFGLLVLALGRGYGAEAVSIKTPDGHIMLCEVVKMSKAGVVLKTDGKEQTLPLELLALQEVQECYKQIANKDAALRFEMGAYFLKKQLMAEAELELNEAVKLDPKLADKAAPLLKALEAKKAPAPTPLEPLKDDISKPPELPKEPIKDPAKKTDDPSTTEPDTEKPADGTEDFTKRIDPRYVAPRTDAEMKEFLQKRQDELTSNTGRKWRWTETKHYYCFSDLSEGQHQKVQVWNERLYERLCDVLKHKEGDKLWNNKCPMYYFHSYKEFQKFAAEVDHGDPNSGGYFMSRGREVHVCIPFMTERHGGSEKEAESKAMHTLKHEGTHAFLQLAGEDVPITRWMHEGFAQFMEFYPFMPDDTPKSERLDRVRFVDRQVKAGHIPSWSMMKQRPMGGSDLEGYGWAWAKMEFLYRITPDKQKLPTMIKLVKSGKPEEEALATAYGVGVERLEDEFHKWLTNQARQNFRWDFQSQ